ncbi:MAG: glycosyltransferase family 2 protein [Nanoarchaeota archaeon]
MNVSVLIPAYNEEKTVGKVIRDFKKHLPDAQIYVCDNNSNDQTAKVVKKNGATILMERRQGKGYALQRLFTVQSEVYIIVDGDDTYPADKVKKLIQPIIKRKADMVIAYREKYNSGLVRNFGNLFITHLINLFFKQKLHDVLSGYRALNNESLKKLNIKSQGFEVESEITIKTIENRFKILEFPIQYKARKNSKLRTYKDGTKIIMAIINLFRTYNPLKFYSCLLISLMVLIYFFINTVV